ncbi:MAG: 6-carboxytetrahydropterin synthase QueD [bacterium]|nr:6-carboxytetrahydropterin synthase QueD [bacterium]
MPYEITITDYFAAAHYLDGYQGSCENVHGHNFKVEATCLVAKLDDIGISLDFKELKKHLGGITSRLDHISLNEFDGFQVQNPTAENLARYIYIELAIALADTDAKVTRVTVYESEKYAATYYE